jgi:hypothetical protein
LLPLTVISISPASSPLLFLLKLPNLPSLLLFYQQALPICLLPLTMPVAANVHVSSHPLLQAKLSQLRSSSTTTRETRSLVHEIATILGVEAFAGWKSTSTGKTVRLFPRSPKRHI